MSQRFRAVRRAGLPALALAALLAGCDAGFDPQSAGTAAPESQAAARPGASDADADVIPGQYIVVLREQPGSARAQAVRAAVLDEVRGRGAGRVAHEYGHALNGFAATLPDGEADRLRRDPRVAYVEADQRAYASLTQSGATWGLDRIDQRDRPLSTTFTYRNTGAGVTAYIIDTGIRYAHSEFGGRASFGFDAFTDGRRGEDCDGHGTHVAGTVGGATYGVAKEVALVAVRVLDCGGSGSWSGVIAGMDWVTANHRSPAVANMSLGGGASTAVDDAARRMIASGVATAIAAGNGNRGGRAQDACGYSPARVAEAMTIGATTNTDAKTSWSNYGACVDFFAPGASITSAGITSNTVTATMSGTSMASPHVAGVAALYLGGNANATPRQVSDALYAATSKGKVTSASTANNHLLFTGY